MIVVVIAGPTASGKSAVAIELAKLTGGEVVSADSMMVYKYMNIGTAKPTEKEMQGIKHHIIDIIEPDQNFSVADYKKLALDCINDIASRGKLPIVAGGTGLYINSLVHGIDYSLTDTNPEIRKELILESEKMGYQYMLEKLREVDPVTAGKLQPADKKRIIRALEVFKVSGRTISDISKKARVGPGDIKYKVFGLSFERSVLYDRINKRVDKMLEDGLLKEVLELRSDGYLQQGQTSSQAIGYKEMCSFIDGLCSYEEAVEKIKTGTRNYAKRQITWFKKTEGLEWLHIQTKENPVEIASDIEKKLHNLSCQV